MSAVSDILLAPDVRPFAVAAAIMVALGGIELLTTHGRIFDQRSRRPRCRGRGRQPRRARRPVSLDQRRAAAAADPAHPGARRVLDRRVLAAGHRACARPRRAGRDRGVRRRGRQHSRRSGPPAAASPASFRATRPMRSRRRFRRQGRAWFRSDRWTRDCPAASVSRMSSATGTPCRRAPVPIRQHFAVGASVLLVDRDAKSFIAISAPADLIAQQRSSDRA